MEQGQQSRSSLLTLPGAVIIAGTIIAIAIIWVRKPASTAITMKTTSNQSAQEAVINLAPVTAADHILGNPNAPVKIVEYSDPSCGFCKLFNPSLSQIMDQYGSSGKIAWVYRSFPLDKPDAIGDILHPNAGHESQALECAALLGDNNRFWAYEKKIYGMDTSASGLDQKLLPIMAKEIGLDVIAFNKCLSSGQFKSKVEADYASGVKAGVLGTPASFFVLAEPLGAEIEKYIGDSLIQYRVPPEMLYVANDKNLIVMNGALPKAFLFGLVGALIGN